jgi:ribosome-binding protein aMBF1 (putative translation factor)
MDIDTKNHQPKQPRRPHHIQEWAEARGLNQAELAVSLTADKSLVSRWYKGATPGEKWQERLAKFFGCDPESLFRRPADAWMTKFMEGRGTDEVARIKTVLENAFPPRTGTTK